MAIQTNGTTRISNSGELQNIGSLDSTTTSTIAAASSPATSYGAVGTYTFGYILAPIAATATIAAGTTISGSSIKNVLPTNTAGGNQYSTLTQFVTGTSNPQPSSSGLSGTWRYMAIVRRTSSYSYGDNYYSSFFVRIS